MEKIEIVKIDYQEWKFANISQIVEVGGKNEINDLRGGFIFERGNYAIR